MFDEKKRKPKKTPDQLRRQMSRVALELVARTKRREDANLPPSQLLELLTAQHAAELAALLAEPPQFFNREEGTENHLLIDDEIRSHLPTAFFQDPTAWIESQLNIWREDEEDGLPTGRTMKELFAIPYDVSKVKQFTLGLGTGNRIVVVSKRIERGDLAEVARARQAYEAGIPTPRVLAEIVDHGNVYAWFERIPGRNLSGLVDMLNDTEGWPSFLHTGIDFDISIKNSILRGLPKDRIERLRAVAGTLGRVETLKTILSALLYHIRTSTDTKELRWYSRVDIQAALNILGFDRLEDYLSRLGEWSKETPNAPNAQKEICQKLFHEYFYAKENDTYLIWRRAVHEELFGYDLNSEIKRLGELCDQAQISHKDLHLRNILVEWDNEKGLPLRRDGAPARLYLIDWELRK